MSGASIERFTLRVNGIERTVEADAWNTLIRTFMTCIISIFLVSLGMARSRMPILIRMQHAHPHFPDIHHQHRH